MSLAQTVQNRIICLDSFQRVLRQLQPGNTILQRRYELFHRLHGNPLKTVWTCSMVNICGVEFADSVVTLRRDGVETGNEQGQKAGIGQGRRIKKIEFVFPKIERGIVNMQRRVLVDKILKYLSPRSGDRLHSAFKLIDGVGNELGIPLRTMDHDGMACRCATEHAKHKSLTSYSKGIAITSDCQNVDTLLQSSVIRHFEDEDCPYDRFITDISTEHPDSLPQSAVQARNNNDRILKTEFCYHDIEMQPTHPLFIDDMNIPVFHSICQAMHILEQCRELPVVSELLDRVSKHLDDSEKPDRSLQKYPFIVVEGVDGSGKSTLVRNLGSSLGARCLQTPPDPIKDLRRSFDEYPEMLRRAYYAVGNYIAERKVLELTQTQPVIMDRFWHSTTAYALAHECNCGDGEHLPASSHAVFRWPGDLIKPSAVIFTFVPERERRYRVTTRGKEVTEEEKDLSSNTQFRKRLYATYEKIDCNLWIEVNTGGSKDQSLERAVRALVDRGLF